MGLPGRCEAIRAPTTENDTATMAKQAIEGSPLQARKISPRVRPLRKARIRLAAVSATHSRDSDQASHAAIRTLIPPIVRLFSLATLVTTLLYRNTVSQTLQQRLSTLEAKCSRGIGRSPDLLGNFFPINSGLMLMTAGQRPRRLLARLELANTQRRDSELSGFRPGADGPAQRGAA